MILFMQQSSLQCIFRGPRTTENKGQFGDRGEIPLKKLSQTATYPPLPRPEEPLM